VLDRFFQGSVSAWRERRNHKNNSVRRLAERPGCPLSRSALNRAVAICAVTRDFPAVLRLERIEAGHIGVVLSVPGCHQEPWLQRANMERLSVRQLKAAIQAERRAAGARRGRPPAAPLARALSAIRASLERLEAAVAHMAGVEPDADASPELEELSERLAVITAQITVLRCEPTPARHDSGIWVAEGTAGDTAAEDACEETKARVAS
jgi:hypothetical protein